MRNSECGIEIRASLRRSHIHSAFPISAFRIRSSMHRVSDFDYRLPPELIAQEPLPDRAGSRLLVLDRAGSGVRPARFPDFVDLVAPEDVLVLNVSRVIPVRLHGKREMGKIAELLLVRELPDGSWIAMGHPGGKLKPGRRVTFGDDSAAEIVGRMGGGLRRVRFVGALDARATLAKYGEGPLPPYIRRPPRPEPSSREPGKHTCSSIRRLRSKPSIACSRTFTCHARRC